MMDVYSNTRQLSLFAEDMIQRQIGPKTFIADSAPEFSTLINRAFGALVDSFRTWSRRRAIETELYALSTHLLDDIGVVRGEIPAVARRWAVAEVERHRDERRTVKAHKVADAAKVTPFAPTTEATAAPAVVANDHARDIAA